MNKIKVGYKREFRLFCRLLKENNIFRGCIHDLVLATFNTAHSYRTIDCAMIDYVRRVVPGESNSEIFRSNSCSFTLLRAYDIIWNNMLKNYLTCTQNDKNIRQLTNNLMENIGTPTPLRDSILLNTKIYTVKELVKIYKDYFNKI